MFISLSRLEREQIEATMRRGFTPEEQKVWNEGARSRKQQELRDRVANTEPAVGGQS